MLLIDNNKAELGKVDLVLDQGMGPNQEIQVFIGQVVKNLPAVGGLGRARQAGQLKVRRQEALGRLVVLVGQDLCRYHKSPLVASVDSRH